jgi:hypothetical protein
VNEEQAGVALEIVRDDLIIGLDFRLLGSSLPSRSNRGPRSRVRLLLLRLLGIILLGLVLLRFVFLGLVFLGFVLLGFVFLGLVFLGFVLLGFVFLGLVFLGLVLFRFVFLWFLELRGLGQSVSTEERRSDHDRQGHPGDVQASKHRDLPGAQQVNDLHEN